MSKVVIVGAARTPIGKFRGGLASLTAPQLGASCIAEALRRAEVTPQDVQEVFLGNVLSAGLGQAPARTAARLAGLPDTAPALTVNRVCGSGLQAVLCGVRAILAGERDLVVAGGMESMSNAPHILKSARAGYRFGHGEIVDLILHDGLTCAHSGMTMGALVERALEAHDITRAQQDAFAAESYRRARAAATDGLFARELVPLEVPGRRGSSWVREDEQPFADDISRLSQLAPAFSENGTITAGNASTLNDGAAAVVVMSEQEAMRRRLRPLATIVSYAITGGAPEHFSTAPVGAAQRALATAGLELADIDLFEINQAFSASSIAVARALKLDAERVDVHGGAVALGHPIGASGARILVTLLHALEHRGARRGLATVCIGGGEAIAVVVERAA